MDKHLGFGFYFHRLAAKTGGSLLYKHLAIGLGQIHHSQKHDNRQHRTELFHKFACAAPRVAIQ